MKILVVTGSSGGHIFPALSLLEKLKETQPVATTLLVMPRQRIETRTAVANFAVAYVRLTSLSFKVSVKSFFGMVRFVIGSLESAWIVATFRPDIIVGFGSIISVPIVFWGHLFGVKTLIHEQNVIPGKANRMLMRFADRVALSFDESRAYLKNFESKAVLTGNPLRKSMEKLDRDAALSFLGLEQGRVTLLVMGGSQGSHSVNSAFIRAVSKISCRDQVQVIHLCGAADYESLNESYRANGVRGKLFDFLRPVQYAYSAADLVIARSGAATIAELLFFRIPAVLIPYPFAHRHQNENAKVLQRMGTAVIIQDDQATASALQEALEKMLSDERLLYGMRQRYEMISRPDASDSLAKEVIALVKRR